MPQVPYGIVVSYESAAAGGDEDHGEEKDDVAAQGSSARLYARGEDLPAKSKRMAFHKKAADFTVTAAYDGSAEEFLPQGEEKGLGKYTIKVLLAHAPPPPNPFAHTLDA